MSAHAAHFPVATIDLALCRGPVVIAALSDRPAISRGKWGGGGGGSGGGCMMEKSFLSSMERSITSVEGDEGWGAALANCKLYFIV